MPYIEEARRPALRKVSGAINAGEFNYELTTLAISYANSVGKWSYATICLVMGSFVCAMFEFYRRVAVPYEDEKAQINGDVY